MKPTLYGFNDNSLSASICFFKKHNMAYEVHYLKKQELTGFLCDWMSCKNWMHFIRKPFALDVFLRYEKKPIGQLDFILLCADTPQLINWPVLVFGKTIIVGYNERDYLSIFSRIKPMTPKQNFDSLLDLAKRLVGIASVTPDQTPCQSFISETLAPLGFQEKNLPFGDVNNLWLRYGDSGPLFVFAGHTDVVPAGNLDQWQTPPFVPYIDEEGVFYGRGVSDMKGAIACMMQACIHFMSEYKNQFDGSIAFLITGDEEGPAVDGTVKVVDYLKSLDARIDYCLVGEPTSKNKLGDTIKPGRRGSITAYITIEGKQGHVAYPKLAQNPSGHLAEFLNTLNQVCWDNGNDYFQPTSCQVFSIDTATHVSNVIPGSVTVGFNLRYSPETNYKRIRSTVENLLERVNNKFNAKWSHNSEPFLSTPGKLAQCASEAVHEVCGYSPVLNTEGGTSDARFIRHISDQIIELGLRNNSIHQINEHSTVSDLNQLYLIYFELLKKLFL